MSNQITIRPCNSDSKDRIISILRKIDDEVIPSISSRIDIATYADKLLSRAVCLDAFIEHTYVGFAAVYCNDSASRTAFLSIIGVHPEFRGRSIGRTLLTNVSASAADNEMRVIELETHENNHSAITLFEQFGFERISQQKSGAVRMAQRLTEQS